jgi:hypothetical protein
MRGKVSEAKTGRTVEGVKHRHEDGMKEKDKNSKHSKTGSVLFACGMMALTSKEEHEFESTGV